MTNETLVELIVLKNNYFQFGDKTFKQKRATAIEIKFITPLFILLMVDLEESLLRYVDLKLCIWWRYIDYIFRNIFLIWEHGEESLKLFLEKIKAFS